MSILKEGKNMHCLEYYNFVHVLIPLRKLLSLTLIPRCKNYCSRGLLSRCVTDNPGRRPREREEIERQRTKPSTKCETDFIEGKAFLSSFSALVTIST